MKRTALSEIEEGDPSPRNAGPGQSHANYRARDIAMLWRFMVRVQLFRPASALAAAAAIAETCEDTPVSL
jgi:hypothetical protein